MTQTAVLSIPLTQLAIAFVPVLVVLLLFSYWQLNVSKTVYALTRMLGQLLLIGYGLTYLFTTHSAMVVLLALTVMLSYSSWVSLSTIHHKCNWHLYQRSFIAIAFGAGIPLAIMTQFVINLQPWYEPRYMIALSSMAFSTAMNNVSLSAERFYAELEHKHDYTTARDIAFNAAMIPIINSMFVVGLVTFPGMMTGQILSGVSPFIAARYQIMVMCMIFSSAGLTSACFLLLVKPKPHATNS